MVKLVRTFSRIAIFGNEVAVRNKHGGCGKIPSRKRHHRVRVNQWWNEGVHVACLRAWDCACAGYDIFRLEKKLTLTKSEMVNSIHVPTKAVL